MTNPFIDLAPFFHGDPKREMPTVGAVHGGKSLLYAGHLNEIHGVPEVGKTNIALAISISVMRQGGHVIFIDPEDFAGPTTRRLRFFGCLENTALSLFHYQNYPTADQFETILTWAKLRKPSLVVLDGLAEALAAEGLDENVPRDILGFFRRRLRPFAEAGAAVLISDHVTKTTEGRGHWARGSGSKLGRYDGVSFIADLKASYSPTIAGSVRLIVAKDRHGGIGVKGQVFTELFFTPDGNLTDFEWRAPSEATPFRPTALMEKVSRFVEANARCNKRQIRAGVSGKASMIDAAIACLEKEEHLVASAEGKSLSYTSLRPYRQPLLNGSPTAEQAEAINGPVVT